VRNVERLGSAAAYQNRPKSAASLIDVSWIPWLCEEFIVVGMGANPDPIDSSLNIQTEGTVVASYAH